MFNTTELLVGLMCMCLIGIGYVFAIVTNPFIAALLGAFALFITLMIMTKP